MSAGQSHLVLGGARSGKSRYALALALRAGGRIAFLATARPLDRDMAARIARHRSERPSGWRTVEEPLDIAGACRRLAGEVDLVLLDCLTLWVSNRMSQGEDDTVILAAPRSVELGHRHVLDALQLDPYLDLGMRLGEGTGAALCIGLARAAARILGEMATFKSAGASGESP